MSPKHIRLNSSNTELIFFLLEPAICSHFPNYMYGIVVHLVVQIRWEECSKASFISFTNSVWLSVDSTPKTLMDPSSSPRSHHGGSICHPLLRLQQCCPPSHIAFSLIFFPSALTLLPK